MRHFILSIALLIPTTLLAEQAGLHVRQERYTKRKSDVTGRDAILCVVADGSAFGIDLSPQGIVSKKLVMTVAHNVVANGMVVEPSVQIGEEWHRTTLLYMDEELDIALLEVHGNDDVPNRLKVAKADAKAGDAVALEGAEKGKPVKRRDGSVSKLRWHDGVAPTIWTLVAIEFDHGDSGGPLMDKDGHVVGMATRGLGSGGGAIENDKGLFVPASAIQSFIDEYCTLERRLANEKKHGPKKPKE